MIHTDAEYQHAAKLLGDALESLGDDIRWKVNPPAFTILNDQEWPQNALGVVAKFGGMAYTSYASVELAEQNPKLLAEMLRRDALDKLSD